MTTCAGFSKVATFTMNENGTNSIA
jgi:hypothetical protein